MVHLQPTPSTSCLILQQQRYGSSTTTVKRHTNGVYHLVNYPITLHRDRYPSPHRAHAWICSLYLLLAYTRQYYSNPTAAVIFLSTANVTPFAHKEHNQGFPDFRVQKCSHFLFCARYFLRSRRCQAFHIIYIYIYSSPAAE